MGCMASFAVRPSNLPLLSLLLATNNEQSPRQVKQPSRYKQYSCPNQMLPARTAKLLRITGPRCELPDYFLCVHTN